MRHTEYMWFRTHTTLVALLVVHIRLRVGAHLEEQFESEFGVSWSCGELLGCSVAHTSLYLLRILLFSIQIGYPLCQICHFSFRLALYSRSSCTYDTNSWVVFFSVFRIRTYEELIIEDLAYCFFFTH